MATPGILGLRAMRYAGGVLAIGAGAAAFASRARLEALQADAWCGAAALEPALLGHCLSCWSDAGLAAASVLLLSALAYGFTAAFAEAHL